LLDVDFKGKGKVKMVTNTNNTNDEIDESVAKKPYSSPVLSVHGPVAQLTLGGIGGSVEGSAMTSLMKHP
jgi:hypothetical protein